MKIELKINPYNYPIIIITAFVIGFILAIALGFRPEHGSREGGDHGAAIPARVQTISLQDLNGL